GRRSTGNSILGNRIRGNALPGAVLQQDEGASHGTERPTDPGDAEQGPNRRQSSPALVRVARLDGPSADATGAKIEGTLESAPHTTFRLEFFSTRARIAGGDGPGSAGPATSRSPRQGDNLLA